MNELNITLDYYFPIPNNIALKVLKKVLKPIENLVISE